MEFLNALGFNFKMVFMQAVGFLILLFLLKKFLFGKIKDMIKARSDEIKDTYKKSDDDRAEAGKLKGEYETRMQKADEEAEEKIQAAVVTAKDLSDSIVQKSQKDAADNMAKAQLGIDLERKRALVEVRNQVVELTMVATTKLVQKSINKEKAEKLVDEVISGVGKLS